MKLDYREAVRSLDDLYEKATHLYDTIDVNALKKELEKLEQEILNEDIWKNQKKATEINQKISRLRKRTEPWTKLINDIKDEKEITELALSESSDSGKANSESDESMLEDISNKIDMFYAKFEELENIELFTDESDYSNAFVTIHPGAGGTESQDWALMLYRMYLRWAEENGFSMEEIDYMPGEEAGIKTVTVLLKGDYAFGLMKCERGIHRLVRISPFDANSKRHTSFASIDVTPEAPEEADIEINENDLRIDTYRSSGAGGQHVNTTDSAVRITHIPTGIVVQCQNERSQHKNKAFAMNVLKSKLYDLRRKELNDEMKEKMGQKKEIAWGNQIRSYVFHPYTMVKDHRTNEETGNAAKVLDGDLNKFIYAYLRGNTKKSEA